MLRSLVVLLALGVVAGCAAPAPPPAPSTALVWPPPPQPARIRYVGSVATPEDLEIRKSWLRRVWEVIAGRTQVRILRPHGVAADQAGRVYVADPAARVVHVFDTVKREYRALERAGRRPFQAPMGVAVSARGRVFVSDPDLGTVVALAPDGKLVRELDAGLQRPTGLSVSPVGDRVYVVETSAHRVAIFDAEGSRVGTIGQRGTGPGDFNFPTHVAVDRAGVVYVTDSMNFRVKMFGPDGAPLGQFGHHGDGTGDLARPKGLGVDSEGHVYVVEGLHDVFQIFDRQGRFLLAVGGTGMGLANFWLPTGLHVDGNDRIYVADTHNGRVQIFQYLRGAGG